MDCSCKNKLFKIINFFLLFLFIPFILTGREYWWKPGSSGGWDSPTLWQHNTTVPNDYSDSCYFNNVGTVSVTINNQYIVGGFHVSNSTVNLTGQPLSILYLKISNGGTVIINGFKLTIANDIFSDLSSGQRTVELIIKNGGQVYAPLCLLKGVESKITIEDGGKLSLTGGDINDSNYKYQFGVKEIYIKNGTLENKIDKEIFIKNGLLGAVDPIFFVNQAKIAGEIFLETDAAPFSQIVLDRINYGGSLKINANGNIKLRTPESTNSKIGLLNVKGGNTYIGNDTRLEQVIVNTGAKLSFGEQANDTPSIILNKYLKNEGEILPNKSTFCLAGNCTIEGSAESKFHILEAVLTSAEAKKVLNINSTVIVDDKLKLQGGGFNKMLKITSDSSSPGIIKVKPDIQSDAKFLSISRVSIEKFDGYNQNGPHFPYVYNAKNSISPPSHEGAPFGWKISMAYKWNGSRNKEWTTSSNWSYKGGDNVRSESYPGTGTNDFVEIERINSNTYPKIADNLKLESIKIDKDAVLDFGDNSLNLYSDLICNGELRFSAPIKINKADTSISAKGTYGIHSRIRYYGGTDIGQPVGGAFAPQEDDYYELYIEHGTTLKLGNQNINVKKVFSNEGKIEINGEGNFALVHGAADDIDSGEIIYSYERSTGEDSPLKVNNFNKLTIKKGKWSISDETTISNKLHISSAGKLLINSAKLEVKGITENNGDINAEESDQELIFKGDIAGSGRLIATSGELKIYKNADLSSMKFSHNGGTVVFYDNTILKTQSADRMILHNLRIHNGAGLTLERACPLVIIGDWINEGSFAGKDYSTVEFLSEGNSSINAHKISGNNNFFNFICKDAGKELLFQNTKVQNIKGKFHVSGSAGSAITLKAENDSNETSEDWIINCSGETEISYVKVCNSHNENSYKRLRAENSEDLGYNINWNFPGAEYKWTGEADSRWENPRNWSPESVPGSDVVILIDSVNSDHYPKIERAVSIDKGEIIIASGASMDFAGYEITAQSLINKGTLRLKGKENLNILNKENGEGSTVEYYGDVDDFQWGTVYENLIFERTAHVIKDNPLVVNGNMSIFAAGGKTVDLSNIGNQFKGKIKIGSLGEYAGEVKLKASSVIDLEDDVYCNSLELSSRGSKIKIGKNVFSNNNQTYSSKVDITGSGDVKLRSFSGGIHFKSNLDGRANLNAAAPAYIECGSLVGEERAFKSINLVSKSIKVNGGAITSEGRQVFDGNVTLGGTSISSEFVSKEGAVEFRGSINGEKKTSVTAKTDAIFHSSLGNEEPLYELTVSAENTIKVGGENFKTTGKQQYLGKIEMSGSLNDIEFYSSSNSIIFNTPLDGSKSAVISAPNGGVFFNRDLGAAVPLASLSVTAGEINVFCNKIKTTGVQKYLSKVLLDDNYGTTEFKSEEEILFSSTLDGSKKVMLDAGNGNITLGAAVGSDKPVTAIEADAALININGKNITTSNNQSYKGKVKLGGYEAVNFTSMNGSMEFFNELDGAKDVLFFARSGRLVLKQAVGKENPFSKLEVSVNKLEAEGGYISSSGDQIYSGSVELGGDHEVSRFDSVNGSIKFKKYLNGEKKVFIYAPNADAAFFSEVGKEKPLSKMEVNASVININGTHINSKGEQRYIGKVKLDGASSNTKFTSEDGDILFESPLNGAKEIDIYAKKGDIKFFAPIGSERAILGFKANAGKNIIFNGVGTNSIKGIIGRVEVEAGNYIEMRGSSYFTENAQNFRAPNGGVRIKIDSNGIWNCGASEITLDDTDLYINGIDERNSNVTLAIGSKLFCRNLYLYRGKLSAPNVEINTKSSAPGKDGNFVVLGKNYNFDDPRYSGIDNRFEYYGLKDLAYKLYSDEDYSGEFINLNKTVFNVEGNFYINGADLFAEDLTLKIPSNDKSNPVFNNTKEVTPNQWGIPYAVAFNMRVKNVSTVCSTQEDGSAWVAAAEGAYNQNVKNEKGNEHWQFSCPEIREAYTVYDDVVYVKFNMDLENSNEEIRTALKVNSSKISEGGIWYNKGALRFSDNANYVYSDADCTQPLGNNDIPASKGFYIKTKNGTWNTDATGYDAFSSLTKGTEESTDRNREHKTITPDISFLTGLFTSANGHTMCRNYGTGSEKGKSLSKEDGYKDVKDKCSPVLLYTKTGQELHSRNTGLASSQHHYDAHNFIEFIYSEPVNTGAIAIGGEFYENLKSTSQFGEIIQRGNGININGIAFIEKGVVKCGKDDAEDTTVHALYRVFSIKADRNSIKQPNRMRISIAGYAEEEKINLEGRTFNNWKGYIDEAEMPEGKVKPVQTDLITDFVGNIIDASGTVNHPLPKDLKVDSQEEELYGKWDITPPVFAEYRKGTEKGYEIIGASDSVGGNLERVEFHLFDNGLPENSESENNKYYWHIKKGWCNNDTSDLYKPYSYAADIFGGSRQFDDNKNRRTSGGIRYSSLYSQSSAFSYRRKDSSYSPFGKQDITAGAKSLIFLPMNGDKNPVLEEDSLYFAVHFDRTDLPTGTTFKIKYSQKGLITDLAGNRMKEQEVDTIDIAPPAFYMSVAAVKDDSSEIKELYVVFNKKLNLDTITIHNDDGKNNRTEPALDLIPKSLRLIDAKTFKEYERVKIDSESPARVKFQSSTHTGLLISLTEALTFDEVSNLYLQSYISDDEVSTDPISGLKNVHVTYIQDDFQNYLPYMDAHAVSDFAVNVISPVFAYDDRQTDDGNYFGLNMERPDDENWAVHDWSEEQGNYGTLLAEHDLFIFTKLNENNKEGSFPKKIYGYFDVKRNLTPGSVSQEYNENIDISKVPAWRIWLPSEFNKSRISGLPIFTSLSSKNNDALKSSFVQIEGKFKEHPNKPGEQQGLCFDLNYKGSAEIKNAGWESGDKISFLFGLADESGYPIEICRNPIYDRVSKKYDTSDKSPLFALRLIEPFDLASLDLWSFQLEGKRGQRGGVTVMNNVLNALTGEKTVIHVDMPKDGNLDVIIMTLDGNVVQYLQHGFTTKGEKYYTWSGRMKNGNIAARGMYFLRVIGSGIDETRKIMLIKD